MICQIFSPNPFTQGKCHHNHYHQSPRCKRNAIIDACIIISRVFQWYMVTLVHVYNRWSRSEIRAYVDGQLVSSTDMSWLVSTSDVSVHLDGTEEGLVVCFGILTCTRHSVYINVCSCEVLKV